MRQPTSLFPEVQAMFPGARGRAGMYESFYLRAVAPDRPLGVWIRYTVHQQSGQASTPVHQQGGQTPTPAHRRGGRASIPPQGSVWCTVFDGPDRSPFMHKLTTDELSVPPGGWIAVGACELGPAGAEGVCGEARWSLRFAALEPELRHLPHSLLYRTPLPRTKLSSPAPLARFDGALVLGDRTIELDGWHGMVGHNWGAQHAERWIWLHGIGFGEDPHAWIDVAIGRVRVAGRTTPWIANGALHIDGARHRLGGLGARGLLVAERPDRCTLSLPGADGLVVEAHIHAPSEALAGWRYADPSGHRSDGHRPQNSGLHDVSNCSIAALTLVVRRPGHPARTLRTAHGAAYELGMRERDHGVPIAPFSDG
jgi:hypothetical protein